MMDDWIRGAGPRETDSQDEGAPWHPVRSAYWQPPESWQVRAQFAQCEINGHIDTCGNATVFWMQTSALNGWSPMPQLNQQRFAYVKGRDGFLRWRNAS